MKLAFDSSAWKETGLTLRLVYHGEAKYGGFSTTIIILEKFNKKRLLHNSVMPNRIQHQAIQ